MEGSICTPRAVLYPHTNTLGGRLTTANTKYDTNILIPHKNHRRLTGLRLVKKSTAVAAVGEFSAAADPAQAELTWQIVVGSLAGVTPFVVAGIEFSKRIVAQRNCEQCGGSGLVLREKNYFKCPGCGGFLPWQSWKRFFSG